jgi:hypothetical protein
LRGSAFIVGPLLVYKTISYFFGLYSMIILKESILTQTFKIIPRAMECDRIEVVNSVEGTSESVDVTPLIDRYFLEISAILDIKENNFYTLNVYSGTDIVFKGRIFCTNQQVKDYTVNKDTYTEQTSTNEFVILD